MDKQADAEKYYVFVQRTTLQIVFPMVVKSIAKHFTGARLQEIATQMAEAVVKFEMLSTNPKSTVRDISHARLEVWLADC